MVPPPLMKRLPKDAIVSRIELAPITHGDRGLGNLHDRVDSGVSDTNWRLVVQPRIYADLKPEQHGICANSGLFTVRGQV